ncbi:MAG: ABC transporter substrate-binding protein [Trueperaceae bacterium]
MPVLLRLARVSTLFIALILVTFVWSPWTLQAQNAEPTGTLVIAQPTDLLYTDPNVAKASQDSNYHMAVFDRLVDRGPDGKIVPLVAESWENPAPTEWIFHIRSGIEFHNGEVLDAHAVTASLDRVTTPMKDFTTVYPDYQGLESWEALDDYTVKIITNEPDPLFLGRFVRFFITPPAYIAEVGNEGFEENPVGSGPFIFVSRVKDSYIRLRANPDYWRGTPRVAEVEFRIIPDSATAVQALKAGEVDIVQSLPADQFDVLNAGRNTKALSVPSARVPFVWLYPSSPQDGEPLVDQRVRQALNLGVNIDNIITYVLQGQATRVSTIVPPMVFAYDESLEPYPYDPERAMELLAEAGYPDGFDVVFEVPSSGITAKPVEVGEAIAADLLKIGVRATVRPRELASWFTAKVEGLGAPLMLWSWGGGDNFDPQTYFHGVFHPNSRYTLDTDPEIIALIDQASSTTDQEERERLLTEAQRVVKERALAIFLYAPNDLYGVDRNLVWQPRSDERIVVWDAYFENQD